MEHFLLKCGLLPVPGQDAGFEKIVNGMTIQPFVNYNMDDGWFLTTVPIITANWDADE